MLPCSAQDPLLNTKFLPNLVTSVTTLLSNNTASEPPQKRLKTENGDTKTENPPLNDPHQVWIGQPENQEVPETFGAVVVQLTQKGLVNALASSGDMDAQQVGKMATALHWVVQTKMERDFLETTPERIREMLCSDVPPAEFRAIRRRVYDTVILGKGMTNSQVEEDDLPVAARATVHDIEKVRACSLVSMKQRFNHLCSLLSFSSKNAKSVATMTSLSLYWIKRMAMLSVPTVGPFAWNLSCMKAVNIENSKVKSIGIIMAMSPIHSIAMLTISPRHWVVSK